MKQKNNDTPLITNDKNTLMIQSQLLLLSITFLLVTEIVHSKIKCSNKSFKTFLSLEINDSFIIRRN